MPAEQIAEPIAAPIPTPPIALIDTEIVLPLADLPEVQQPLPTINPLFSDIINIHPIQNFTKNTIPKLSRAPKFSHYTHSKSNTANIHVCHRPVRELIPNAVCPNVLPRFISHRLRTRRGNTRAWFTVTFNNYRIEYPYGGRTGYTKENAYMEAARCLRHLFVHQIQLLDNSMGPGVDVDDIFDILYDYDNDDVDNDSTFTPDTNLHSVINIVNSNVTITNTPNRHIVYDDDDNLEFVFESPEGTFGAPPAEGDDIEGFEGLDFGEIIEI